MQSRLDPFPSRKKTGTGLWIEFFAEQQSTIVYEFLKIYVYLLV